MQARPPVGGSLSFQCFQVSTRLSGQATEIWFWKVTILSARICPFGQLAPLDAENYPRLTMTTDLVVAAQSQSSLVRSTTFEAWRQDGVDRIDRCRTARGM
jgi:hypothetical protein